MKLSVFAKALGDRVLKAEPCPHPIYGDITRKMYFANVEVMYHPGSGRVYEIVAHRQHEEFDGIVWVDPDYELDIRSANTHPTKFEVFSATSMTAIAVAVESGVEFDVGLLFDVSIELEPELLESVIEICEQRGISIDKFVDEALQKFMQDQNCNTSVETGQDPSTSNT